MGDVLIDGGDRLGHVGEHATAQPIDVPKSSVTVRALGYSLNLWVALTCMLKALFCVGQTWGKIEGWARMEKRLALKSS
ncbi:hypothetical protein EDC26_103311 [Paralcaligenes ureilyticus]|uniref:Uncharacterized protein n=1 Tax=Paralcaligenes ureilyticus TaxID=627131 RepID=A0A4R3M997_9BURK|nr:hypothetical protein EDC26_103311 [Paralcaligenes ureilyticus]